MRSIGILGGTFDPVHNGHLRAAIECREKLKLDEVRLMPVNDPGHRNLTIANSTQRLVMLRMATEISDGLEIEDCDINRGGVTYTIDSLEELRQQNKKASLCFILGTDSFNRLHIWKRWKELINYAHLIVVRRPGHPLDPEQDQIRELLNQQQTSDASKLKKQTAGCVYLTEVPMIDISATRLRDIFGNNNDPTGLLPQTVIEYIKQHDLYKKE